MQDGTTRKGADTPAADAALVFAMARGDQRAMEALYDRYAGEIFRLVVGMVTDPQQAEDLLQDIMWQAWRLAGRYDPRRAGVRTWLHVLMRSRVADWRRQSGRVAPVATAADEAALKRMPEGSDPFEAMDRRADLQAAERRLSDAERQALHWTFRAGLTQAEAAEHLHVPLGTVKSRVRSALGRLRDRLDPAAGGGERP